ncbi:MAG TPA: hypothetical protein VGM17_18650 [Rhizomicrobium sp.]|jgi:hypothetical protein
MPAIKVFSANLGFYEVAVAARSQKMALAHWGMRRDLFHEGAAKETHDPKAVEAAMRKVGMVVRRPIGSNGPFEEKGDAERTLLKSLSRKGVKAKPARKAEKFKAKKKRKKR